MTRIWRKSLALQLLASMLLALFLALAIGLSLCWGQFVRELRGTSLAEPHARVASVARLMEIAPAELAPDIAATSGTSRSRYWVTNAPTHDLVAWMNDASARFAARPPGAHGQDRARAPQDGGIAEELANSALPPGASWSPRDGQDAALPAGALVVGFENAAGFGAMVPLGDGRILNAVSFNRALPSLWSTPLPEMLLLTACFVALVGYLTARRIARPLRHLTKAAELLGRGEPIGPVRESGPDDVRRTAEAFNRMQERLHRFVEDRTLMLAAIGHDLRTPLTSLRLRAELVGERQTRAKMLATIDEMQTMTEAALTFAKQETALEPTRTIDLSALVGSLCDDLGEIGYSVAYRDGGRLPYRCRPDGLRRTIRNLIENAVRYAGHAEVRIAAARGSVEVVVEDRGPGIPDDRLDMVFTPFFRMEGSRSRDTGGVGLGLSIARAIARQHGGDIRLSRCDPGLRASLVLPA